jgi:hypothetical protein
MALPTTLWDVKNPMSYKVSNGGLFIVEDVSHLIAGRDASVVHFVRNNSY